MFNNLIESSSHAKEFKRRGSFLLFTSATYLVLFMITGVVSIYAYDAHLESQSTEWEITFMPVVVPEPAPKPIASTTRAPSNSDRNPTESIRTVLLDTINPNNVPPKVSTAPAPAPPALPNSKVGLENIDAPAPPGATDRGVTGGTGNTPLVNITETPPPPPPPAPVVPKIVKVSEGVLRGSATYLPKPIYPPMARQIRLQGSVNVQVLIDEDGKVISAKALSGHPLLVHEAQRAAMQARFTPTKLSNQAVKVSGVITYNFVTQ